MKQVTLRGGKFSLRRVTDGAGDSGQVLISVPKTVRGSKVKTGVIKVGHSIKCGSLTARSYSWQDFWITTEVVKIISVNKDKTKVKFRTKNSTYVAKVIS